MAHERMFEPDDPWLLQIRDLAMTFPDAAEKVTHGRPAFYTTKVFVYYGGSRKVDGEWVQHPQSIMIKPDPEDRRALEEDDRIWVPGYLGASGWLGLDLSKATPTEELAELLESSYRLTAGTRRAARLDAGRD